MNLATSHIDKRWDSPMQPFSYINKHKQTYYLHTIAAANGRSHHVMRISARGAALQLPTGYEIREDVHGRVTVRLARPKQLTSLEEQLIRTGMKKLRPFAYLLDIDGKAATVFASAEDRKCFVDSLEAEFAEGFADALTTALAKRCSPDLVDLFRAKRKEQNARRPRYYPLLRCVLVNRRDRRFAVERVCFSGESSWIQLEVLPLAAAILKYLPHLGHDSFFDLL